jgi:hypothetical protein
VVGGRRRRSGPEELPAAGKRFRALPMTEPAIVADAVEAARQDVQEEAPDEFRRVEGVVSENCVDQV